VGFRQVLSERDDHRRAHVCREGVAANRAALEVAVRNQARLEFTLAAIGGLLFSHLAGVVNGVLSLFAVGFRLIVGLLEFHATILRRPLWRSTRCGNQTAPLPIMPVHNSYSSRRATVAPMTEGKEFSVIQLPTFDWPKSHCVPSPRFRLFVAADVTSVSTDTLSDFSLGALNGGMVYFCAWGNGCERFHDIVDEILVEWTPERGIRRQTGGLESLRSASGATLVAAQLRWRTTPDASPQSAAPIRGAFSACSSRDQQPGVPHIRPWRRFRECYQIQQ